MSLLRQPKNRHTDIPGFIMLSSQLAAISPSSGWTLVLDQNVYNCEQWTCSLSLKWLLWRSGTRLILKLTLVHQNCNNNKIISWSLSPISLLSVIKYIGWNLQLCAIFVIIQRLTVTNLLKLQICYHLYTQKFTLRKNSQLLLIFSILP